MPKDKDKQSILHYFTSRIDFKSKTKEIREYIKAFFTENIETLTSDGFSKRIIYGEVRRKNLVEIYGIDESEWKAFTKLHPILNISENTKEITNELLVVHYIVEKDPILLKFLAVKLFTSKYYRSFPNYIKEAKMKAVIDSLSNKFYIKKHGNLDKALDATVNTYLTTYSKRFLKATDDDIIYIINALSTRVGILVKNVQIKYYNAPDDIGFFEDSEVMEKESKRTTTNDTVIYDNIYNRVKSYEMTYGFNRDLLRQLKGYEYKAVFTNMYKDKQSMDVIISEILYDYIRANSNPPIKEAHDNFLKWSFNNKSRSEKLIKEIDRVAVDNDIEDKNKKEFELVVIRYFSVRIFKEISKESM